MIYYVIDESHNFLSLKVTSAPHIRQGQHQSLSPRQWRWVLLKAIMGCGPILPLKVPVILGIMLNLWQTSTRWHYVKTDIKRKVNKSSTVLTENLKQTLRLKPDSPLKYFMSNRSMSVSTTWSGPSTAYESGVMVENAAYALPRHSIPTDILAHISVDLAYSVTECLIDPERLKLGKSVGKGLFHTLVTSWNKLEVPVLRFSVVPVICGLLTQNKRWRSIQVQLDRVLFNASFLFPANIFIGFSCPGFFGSVHKGELKDESDDNTTTVAVKTVQGENNDYLHARN